MGDISKIRVAISGSQQTKFYWEPRSPHLRFIFSHKDNIYSEGILMGYLNFKYFIENAAILSIRRMHDLMTSTPKQPGKK